MDSGDYILIADCHIRAHSDAEGDFFEMLDRIDAVNPKGVIFLGDIFELWIALKGYESFGHAQFVEWCSEHKKRLEIGFIEGNHEFYVSETHRDAFSWADDASYTLDSGVQFIHGDLINRDDRRYLLLRRLIRNPFTRFLLRLTARNIGPRVADKVRMSLKNTNLRYKRLLPMPHLENYSRNAGQGQIKRVFAGHFHRRETLSVPGGVPTEILPAWERDGEIVMLDGQLRSRCGFWKELLN